MSGYTKLSSSIIHSTIWDEAMHVRIVWITMLALADRFGEVMASVPGLAHASRVTLEQSQEALEKLKAPDPHSRTQDDDGRRIAVIDGGWLILNHAKYRELKSKEHEAEKSAERVKRWRDKKKAEKPPAPLPPTDVTDGNGMLRGETLGSPIAEADTDSKNKEKSAPASASAPEVKKRKGRGVATLEVPEVPDWVEGLATRLRIIWHKADPDGREIKFRRSLVVQRLTLINARQPLYTEQILEDAAKDYLRSQRKSFKSAEHFFTLTKDPHSNDQPPFKEWADTRVHRARAAAKAAAEAAGAPTSPEAIP